MTGVRIAVLGGKGQLGQTLRSWVHRNDPSEEWCFFSSTEVDITNKKMIDSLFVEKGPFHYVVNCAAYTAVDKAESEAEKAEAINTKAVEYLAKICQQQNSTLIHISTDFVFDGTISRPLTEIDMPNPLGVYGQTKYAGEKHIAEQLEAHFILRTSWLYSTFGRNFFLTIQRLTQENKEINVVVDQVGTPTHTEVLANIIGEITTTRSKAFGLYHVSNEGVASWYDFAYEIITMSGSNCRVNPIPTTEYPTPAIRPAYSVLNKTKLKNQFNTSLPHWKESLETCF